MSGRWWPSLHFYAKDSACHITGEWIWMNKQINVEVINKNEPSEKSDVIWIAEVNLSKMAIVIHVLICAFFIHKWTKLWDIFFYIPSSVFLHKFFFFFSLGVHLPWPHHAFFGSCSLLKCLLSTYFVADIIPHIREKWKDLSYGVYEQWTDSKQHTLNTLCYEKGSGAVNRDQRCWGVFK